MVKNSLGLIEIVGLAAALEAADAAMKAANVELIGYELTKGGGLVLIKLRGDVGAVKAAVEAGRIAGSKVNKVWSTQVIPRPHQQLAYILAQEEIIGVKEQPTTLMVNDRQVIGNENEPIVIAQQEKKPADICNLCGDPACHRRKGDPKITCMYHGKNNKEAE